MATQAEKDLQITEKDIQPLQVAPKLPDMRLTFRHSDGIDQLCKALAAAGAEFPEITKDTENPYFRSQYADLATLIKATRPVLSKHGLCIVQAPATKGSVANVTTMLMHTSGQWLSSDLELPSTKTDAQGLGSAITYARRYAYQSILNVAGEEDDDGNAATGKPQEDRKSRSDETGKGRINPVQLRAFNSACKSGQKTEAQIVEYMGSIGHETSEELEKHELDAAIKWALSR